jgi:hypothetical protein
LSNKNHLYSILACCLSIMLQSQSIENSSVMHVYTSTSIFESNDPSADK